MKRIPISKGLSSLAAVSVIYMRLSISFAEPVLSTDATAKEISLNLTGFGDGWKTTVAFPSIDGVTENNTTCRLWVKEGWLLVERTSDDGVEWRFVLAHTIDGITPKVLVSQTAPTIEVSYADGRYFVRDNSVVVRAVRQQSTSPRPTFALSDVITEKKRQSGYAKSLAGFVMTGISDSQWFCTTSGPSREEGDCFVRLIPERLSQSTNSRRNESMGFSTMRDGLVEAFNGDGWILDDGGLLIAKYLTAAQARSALAQQKVRENLPGSELPEIDAKDWLNVDAPLTRKSLKGKVVLLDFWGTWCGACVAKMPDVQRLHDKFAADGLVVIGIHSAESSETCKPFVSDRAFSFPVAVDTGGTAKSYGVNSFPTYFLIGRDGNVVSGYSEKIPSEEQIKTLLK